MIYSNAGRLVTSTKFETPSYVILLWYAAECHRAQQYECKTKEDRELHYMHYGGEGEGEDGGLKSGYCTNKCDAENVGHNAN